MTTTKFIFVAGLGFELLTGVTLALAMRITSMELESGTWHWWSEVLFWFGMLSVQPYVLLAEALRLPTWFGLPGIALNTVFWGSVLHVLREGLRRIRREPKARAA